MTLQRTGMVTGGFQAVQHLSGSEVAHFEPAEIIHVHKDKRPPTVDSKRPDWFRKRADVFTTV